MANRLQQNKITVGLCAGD